MAQTLQPVVKNRMLLHVAGWVIFFVTPLLLSPPHELESGLADPANLESLAIRNLMLMALFYFNLVYLTPIVLKNKGLSSFLLVLIPVVLAVSFVNWQIHHLLAEPFGPGFDGGPPPPPPDDFGPPHGPGPGPRPMMMASSLFASLLISVIVASISTTIVLWDDLVKTRTEERERAFQKVASELAVLKLQISPHFLFNTLNNIRWLVRSRSDRAEEAVIKLSQLLRYILYQTDRDLIALEKEMENLRDYIDLQQMRLKGHENLLVSLKGDPQNRMITPLLFIPIVENVFKYGDFDGPFQNSISLSIEGDRLIFKTQNRVLANQENHNKEESGIGLSNIRKRLLLHYPDKHILHFFEKDDVFTMELEIILN